MYLICWKEIWLISIYTCSWTMSHVIIPIFGVNTSPLFQGTHKCMCTVPCWVLQYLWWGNSTGKGKVSPLKNLKTTAPRGHSKRTCILFRKPDQLFHVQYMFNSIHRWHPVDGKYVKIIGCGQVWYEELGRSNCSYRRKA